MEEAIEFNVEGLHWRGLGIPSQKKLLNLPGSAGSL